MAPHVLLGGSAFLLILLAVVDQTVKTWFRRKMTSEMIMPSCDFSSFSKMRGRVYLKAYFL